MKRRKGDLDEGSSIPGPVGRRGVLAERKLGDRRGQACARGVQSTPRGQRRSRRGFRGVGVEGYRDVFPSGSFPAAIKSYVCIQDLTPPRTHCHGPEGTITGDGH